MAKQLILLLLVIYFVHLYNPKYYEWAQDNIRNFQMFGILLCILFIYRMDEFDDYMKTTFSFFKRLDAQTPDNIKSNFIDSIKQHSKTVEKKT